MLYKDILEMLNENPRVLTRDFVKEFVKSLNKNKRIIKIDVDPEYGEKLRFKMKLKYKSRNGVYDILLDFSEKEKDVFLYVEIENYEGDLDKIEKIKSYRYDILDIGMNGFTLRLKSTNFKLDDKEAIKSSAIKNAMFLDRILRAILD